MFVLVPIFFTKTDIRLKRIKRSLPRLTVSRKVILAHTNKSKKEFSQRIFQPIVN